MNGMIFFFAFGMVQVIMYVIVRRRALPPLLVGVIGVIASIAAIFFMAREQGNNVYQAAFAGILVGGLLSAGTMGMAIYFMNVEQRAAANPELDAESGGEARYQPPEA
jgi:Na+/H+-translocating membrane pyrophosphatase